MPHVFNPKITDAGQAAAIAASNNGPGLALTHIGFSTAVFNPTGAETSLTGEVVRLPISAGARITPTQVRLSATWNANAGTKNINAVGFYAGSTLFAVWSSTTAGATPLAVKTDGIPFVLYYDFVLASLPPESVTVTADTGQSITLLALNNHLSDSNAHPQYQRKDDMANATDNIWCGVAGGTVNDIELTLPDGQILPAYKGGLRFVFKAAGTNTGTVTVKINSLTVKAVKKNGSTALAPTDIVSGGVYELVYDGTNFQISGSAGNNAMTFERHEFTGVGPYSCDYTPNYIQVFLNGHQLSVGDFTAVDGVSVSIPSATSGDEVVIIAFSTFAVANALTMADKASQSQVDALSIDDKFITPKTLGNGFSCAWDGWKGHIKLPSWMGGWVFQVGRVHSLTSGSVSLTFSAAFPNECFALVATPLVGSPNGYDTVSLSAPPTTIGATVNRRNGAAGSDFNANFDFYYIAVGN